MQKVEEKTEQGSRLIPEAAVRDLSYIASPPRNGYRVWKRTLDIMLSACGLLVLLLPMAVVAFLESEDFESAVRIAISYGSDADTIADMAGAIAEAYYGEISPEITEFCVSKIPPKQRDLIREFYKRVRR